MNTIRLTLRPGQNGTIGLKQKYGDRLVAVRYRYDALGQRRLKTVELIEEVQPWRPRGAVIAASQSYYVFVRVSADEVGLRSAIKEQGGTWDVNRKLWRIELETAKRLRLACRIVEEG